MDQVTIFLDTNTPLHYRWIADLDWLALYDAKRVDVVLLPVVVRELDRLKVSGAPRIRRRAQAVIAKLEPLLADGRPVEIRRGVWLRYEPLEPNEEMFRGPQLNNDIADDWLIAAVVQWRDANPGSGVLVITHDLGLRLKSQAMRIVARGLPDELKLKEEPDPIEDENRELKRQLAELQARLPVLAVRFKDGDSYASYRLKLPEELADVEVAARVQAVRKKYPKKKPAARPPGGSSHVNLSAGGLFAEAEAQKISNYNERLDAYYREFDEYVRKRRKFENVLRRVLLLKLEVVNDGTSPADEINLMRVPNSVKVLSEKALSDGPEEPKPPSPPQSMFLPPTSGHRYVPSDLPVIRGNVSGPRIANDRQTVAFTIRRLLHGIPEPLNPIPVIFSSWEKVTSFGVEYEIRSASLPRATNGRIDVVIENPARPES